jgi:hypothetical protein
MVDRMARPRISDLKLNNGRIIRRYPWQVGREPLASIIQRQTFRRIAADTESEHNWFQCRIRLHEERRPAITDGGMP